MTWGADGVLVTIPDVERQVVDLLGTFSDLDAYTKGVGIPREWTSRSPNHLQVASDGEFLDHPVVARSTIRVVAWGHAPTDTKRLAHLAQGLLLAEPGISTLTGVLPATDDTTNAELAMFTVRYSVRSTPIP